MLAYAKAIIILNSKDDPLASEHAISWEKQYSELPKPIESRTLLRDLFLGRYREATITDEGWRDDHQLWIGEIYRSSNYEPDKLYLLIFNSKPDIEQVKSKLKKLSNSNILDDNREIFAVYKSREDQVSSNEIAAEGQFKARIISSNELLFESIDLENYARDLITQFESTKLGGTNVALSKSYVELSVVSNEGSAKQICELIDDWLSAESDVHLAITGEYGQGKSTAMLHYAVIWARAYLDGQKDYSQVPLLIELRGKNPSESDPLEFISTWCSRYGLLAPQVLNLIKSGLAIIILEGFDELRNSGRAYDRHQHFNALWRLAYPKTKLIFTGRPNFFLDDYEANRTLRSSPTKGAAGENHTEVWKIEKMTLEQLKVATSAYAPDVSSGILEAVSSSESFKEIVSRPSMLPVVATIWHEIEEVKGPCNNLTGALLVEKYLQAIYSRKEAELEKDRVNYDAPAESRYITLPIQVRELLTICVAWKIADASGNNTISRESITILIKDLYQDLFVLGKINGVAPEVAERLARFSERHRDATLADRVEIITSEICSAGLLVPDPAGGASNLKFPHKQFYEYLLCKGFCIVATLGTNPLTKLIEDSAKIKNRNSILLSEPNAVNYLTECIGDEMGVLGNKWDYFFSGMLHRINLVMLTIGD